MEKYIKHCELAANVSMYNNVKCILLYSKNILTLGIIYHKFIVNRLHVLLLHHQQCSQ